MHAMDPRRVCVYAGSNAGADPAYAQAARTLGRRLTQRGLGLVYGGASIGLMGEVADAVLAAGGELGIHRKPVGLLDVRGYWDELGRQLDHAVRERFMPIANRRLVLRDASVDGLLDRLEAWRPATGEKWLEPGARALLEIGPRGPLVGASAVALDVRPIAWTNDVFAEDGLHFVTLHHRVEVAPDAEPRLREPDKAHGWSWHRWDALPQPLFGPVAALAASGWRPGPLSPFGHRERRPSATSLGGIPARPANRGA
jgi:Possible lysine decarboxylase